MHVCSPSCCNGVSDQPHLETLGESYLVQPRIKIDQVPVRQPEEWSSDESKMLKTEVGAVTLLRQQGPEQSGVLSLQHSARLASSFATFRDPRRKKLRVTFETTESGNKFRIFNFCRAAL